MSGHIQPTHSMNTPYRVAWRCNARSARPRMNRYLNNPLEQDHRSLQQRPRPRAGFKRVESVKRFCRVHDEVRNFLRPRSRQHEVLSLAQRRLLYRARTHVLLTSSAAADMRTSSDITAHLLPLRASSDTTIAGGHTLFSFGVPLYVLLGGLPRW